MKIVKAIENILGYIENGLLVIFLTVTVVMAFLQVILREFWSTGILWADVFLRHLVLWIGFLGAALAAKESRHFSINIITKRLSDTLRRIVQVLLDLSASVVCYFLYDAGMTFVLDEIKYNTQSLFSFLGIDIMAYHFEIIIPVGFALVGIHFLFRAIETAITGPKAVDLV
ncbi:MAG TPA: TRAP transporter small permease subunit [Candidatus Acidoferrales bacterium]|nr:TRAP transporter small permease subunit [Candidatus Acidoferrales bacterium]